MWSRPEARPWRLRRPLPSAPSAAGATRRGRGSHVRVSRPREKRARVARSRHPYSHGRRIRRNPRATVSTRPDAHSPVRRECQDNRKEADVATFWTITVLAFTVGALATLGFAF